MILRTQCSATPIKKCSAFIDNPFFGLDPSEKLYKTGDVVRWIGAKDGNPLYQPDIEFVGRDDEQVNLGGLRIEPSEIEHCLAEHPQVDYALVLLNETPESKKRLIAYAIMDTPIDTESDWTDMEDELKRHLRQSLPSYMVPSALVCLARFPLMPNGKIDRASLPSPKSDAFTPDNVSIPSQTETELEIAKMFASILGLQQVGANEDFFDLGGHSTLMSQLLFLLRERFQTNFLLSDLYAMPTVSELAVFVDSPGQAQPVKQQIDFRAEISLEANIRPIWPTSYSMPASEAFANTTLHSVFVTGGTGFLGSFVLHELIQQTRANILCLVRCETEKDGADRLRNSLTKYGLWQEEHKQRIRAIPGDLSNPLFGLEPNDFVQLSTSIAAIYHIGADVNLVKPYSELKSVNVLGTQDVIRLAVASSPPVPVYYMSTLSVFDSLTNFDGRCLYENSELGDGQDLFGGYAQSKWVAEQLVAQAKRRGIPVTTYRSGTISGHSKTGAGNTEDFFCRFLKGSIEHGVWPDSGVPCYLAPVDFVSAGIVALSRRNSSRGGIFHLESNTAVKYREVSQWLTDFGYPVRRIATDIWLETFMESANDSSRNALKPLLPMFIESASDKRHRSLIEIFEEGRPPDFDCSGTMDELANVSVSCPQIDSKVFDTYLTYLIENGFLVAPPEHRNKG